MKHSITKRFAVLALVMATVAMTGCGKRNNDPGVGGYPGGIGGWNPGVPGLPGGVPGACASPFGPIAFAGQNAQFTGQSIVASVPATGNTQIGATYGITATRGLQDGLASADGQLLVSIATSGAIPGGFPYTGGQLPYIGQTQTQVAGYLQLSQYHLNALSQMSGVGYGGYYPGQIPGQIPAQNGLCVFGVQMNLGLQNAAAAGGANALTLYGGPVVLHMRTAQGQQFTYTLSF